MSAKPDMSAEMVTIEIDGVSLQAPKGSMIIQAADEANIYIPRFCYHKKLPIAANCRMCLVQVDKVPKPLPACATPVNEGMKIFTRSEFTRRAQKGVMEFLLINHPLDCPICDQGGECELQDIAMGYGADVSRYTENKRVVTDKNIGPLIATEMTRCIHCTRCIRAIELVGGEPELGGMGRGDRTTIGTYIERSIDSVMSGNVIDVCPVGALTAKPSRFGARAWELRAHDGVSPHDCIGSNTQVHSWQGKVFRTVPGENESINEVWIADRDRYGYEGVNSADRLDAPMLKRNGEWQTVDWHEALDAVAEALRATNGSIGALLSPSSTLEEAWLMQKLVRGLGSNNIDFRLRQQDFSADANEPRAPVLGRGIDELEHLDACLLVGSNIDKDQPIASHRLRKAVTNGAQLMLISGADYAPNYPLAANIAVSPARLVGELAAVCKALLEITREAEPQGLAMLLDGVEVNDTHRTIADKLKLGTNAMVVVGMQAMAHPQYAMLRQLASRIASLADAGFGFLPQGANAVGMSLAGATPREGNGQNALQMLRAPLQAYLLLGTEVERDCADPAAARMAMDKAGFVTVMTPFVTDAMREYANVLLPVAPYNETSGTYVNVAGTWQSFSGSAQPFGETRPGWKVLRVLGNHCDLDGFDQLSSEEVLQDVRNAIGDASVDMHVTWQQVGAVTRNAGITRISDMPVYGADAIVRRASALQHTVHAASETARINRVTIDKLGLGNAGRVLVCEGDTCASLALVADERIPTDCVSVDATTDAAAKLGAAYNLVSVEQD